MTTTVDTATIAGVRINGAPVEASTPWQVPVIEPATGRPAAQLLGGGKTEARAALAEAARVATAWGETPAGARAQALRAVAATLSSEPAAEDLAVTISRETGKRLAEARAEVGLSAAFFDWFAAAAVARHGTTHAVTPGMRHEVIQRPLGVVAVLTPWNFPVSIPARKIAPALAAGCPVLFKPSEVAPASALRLAEIVESHLPAGVMNTVIGEPAQVCGVWLDDPQVRGLTFTGSTRVGRVLAAQTAGSFTRNVFELGGNSPFVVLEDADVAMAVDMLSVAKYRNNGQSCIAAQQVWVPEAMLDEVVAGLLRTSADLVLGDPLDPATTLGPLALPDDPERIAALAAAGEAAGATVLRAEVAVPTEGHFAAPTVCVRPPSDSRPVVEEAFGPLATVRPYTSVDEVLAATRADRYGLGAYVVGDPARARTVAQALDVGIVGVNNATPNAPVVPFGGLKHSGLGYEGGQPGLDAFLTHYTTAILT